MDTRRAAELAARHSYGRLVAYLTAQTRDVMAAEDVLGDAFLTALKSWPETGVPQNPEAWLLVSARHRFIDAVRRTQIQDKVLNHLKLNGLESQTDLSLDSASFPDNRLKLLFICAYPAIDPAIHTPLMLQTDIELVNFNIIPLDQQIATIFGTNQPFGILLRPDNYIALISTGIFLNLIKTYFEKLERPILSASAPLKLLRHTQFIRN